ncbi:MAG TPA: hypothetical protein VD860_02310 [Azospirillum sp.]|nr:hypothetical protein [Azospirillum sp.]
MATVRQRRATGREVGKAWVGIAAGPFAWFLHQQVAYALAPLACAGYRWAIPTAGALCALLALAGAALSWRAHGGAAGNDRRFVAAMGMWIALLFLLAIAGQTLAAFVFTGCER